MDRSACRLKCLIILGAQPAFRLVAGLYHEKFQILFQNLQELCFKSQTGERQIVEPAVQDFRLASPVISLCFPLSFRFECGLRTMVYRNMLRVIDLNIRWTYMLQVTKNVTKNQTKNIHNKMLQLKKTNKHKIQTNKKQTQQNETKIDCHYTPTQISYLCNHIRKISDNKLTS